MFCQHGPTLTAVITPLHGKHQDPMVSVLDPNQSQPGLDPGPGH